MTLAVWVRGRIPASAVIPYWGAQVLGAILAGLIFRFLNPDDLEPLPNRAS